MSSTMDFDYIRTCCEMHGSTLWITALTPRMRDSGMFEFEESSRTAFTLQLLLSELLLSQKILAWVLLCYVFPSPYQSRLVNSSVDVVLGGGLQLIAATPS